jgi:cystathionine beta-lyase
MDFQAPEPVRNALHAAVEQGVLGYELLVPRTQQVVAERMERLYGWKVDPDWVVATIGVVHGFAVAARAFCAPPEGVVIQTPVYHMFYTIYPSLGLTKQAVPFHFSRAGNEIRSEVDFDSFSASFHSGGARTRMLLLCHPHNPIGRVFSREELHKMAEICLKNDALIVSDEIHSELLLGKDKHVPVATLSPEIADRTITLIAPSKTFNTCGLFCGFAIISNASLRKRFIQTMDQVSGHVSSLGLTAAEVAFSGACDAWLHDLLDYLRGNRDFVCDYLSKHFPEARFTRPDATFLQWIDFGAYAASGAITGTPQQHFLERAKVAFNCGKTFGEGFESFVRLNFGTPRSLLTQALEQMRASM